MLDFDTALDLLNKYGYTSIQVHPFIYQDGDTIGICYTYIDEEYGLLERIKIFNNAEEFEEFLSMYNWVQVNGKLHHVRMILDNYEAINPKVMFLRNEKIMVEGEMFDIEAYDSRESMRANMDPVSKVIYECGDLLLVYNEIKNRQLQYLKNIIKLKNSLRHKYYDLQLEVDKYNKIKVEKNLTLLPEVADSGINEMLEISIKDRYNGYIAQRPSYEEAVDFLKEVWELCLGLELNAKYYEAQKEENDVRNEMKVVDQKLTLMRSLNDELKPLFGVDLISRFKKINRVCKAESTTISNEFISQQMDAVNRKYSYFSKIDPLYTSDYLREAIQNSNYADLAIKYAPGANFDVVSKYKTPLNEIAASLSVQYRDKLAPDEQAIMVIYNNRKFRAICDAILNVENFETAPIKTILKAVSGIKSFSKIKSECYECVRKRIDDPINQRIKSSLFANFDFTSYETFITSLVKELAKLKNVNEKMVLNGDINMYVSVKEVDDLGKKSFVMTTNDLQGLIAKVKDSKNMVGITLLKEGTPVLYSPYYFDVGDIYTKGASLEMAIKEMVDFEILVDISDIIINIDPNKTMVARYFSTPNIVENLSVVDDIKMSYKTTFCKYALTSKVSIVVTMNQSQAVASSVSPVVNSVFDAGTLAAIPTVEAEVKTDTTPVVDEVHQEVDIADASVNVEEVVNVQKVENTENVEKTDVKVDNKDVTDVNKQSDDNIKDLTAEVKEEKNDSNISGKVEVKESSNDVKTDVVTPTVKEVPKTVENKVEVKDKEVVSSDKHDKAVTAVVTESKADVKVTTGPVVKPVATTATQAKTTTQAASSPATKPVAAAQAKPVSTTTSTATKPVATTATQAKPTTQVASSSATKPVAATQTKPVSTSTSTATKPVATTATQAKPVTQAASSPATKPVVATQAKPVSTTTSTAAKPEPTTATQAKPVTQVASSPATKPVAASASAKPVAQVVQNVAKPAATTQTKVVTTPSTGTKSTVESANNK